MRGMKWAIRIYKGGKKNHVPPQETHKGFIEMVVKKNEMRPETKTDIDNI